MVRRGSFLPVLIFCAVGLTAVGVSGCGRPAPDPDPANPRGAIDKEKGGSDKPGSQPDKLKAGEVVEVPFIFWGGDVAPFVANGGLETKKDSLFGRHDLSVKLTP